MSLDPFMRLLAEVNRARDAWAASHEGSEWSDLPDAALAAATQSCAALRRQVDAVQVQLSAEVSRRSSADLGADSFAKKNGHRNPATLIAATTGISFGEAARMLAVGDATAPQASFGGETKPPRYPHVATALEGGTIGVAAASAIISMLSKVACRAEKDALAEAERVLVEKADGLTLDQLQKIIARAEAYLCPDDLESKEQDLRGQRSLRMFERDGMLHITAKLDPETAAPVKVAIEALVSAEFRHNHHDQVGATVDGSSAPQDSEIQNSQTQNSQTQGSQTQGSQTQGSQNQDSVRPDSVRRSVPQMQADALALLAGHLAGCADREVPIAGPTMIVRVSLADLDSGVGVATIDGIDQPISAGTARRMAASGGVIPCVLGGESEILDWGREKRLFTRAQRLALAERDGGCAMCGLPPGMTKAHHIQWWGRDHGLTNLDQGVLLCESCHHRIHDNGWEVRVVGSGKHGRVWFIPPPDVDPARTPRPGGITRFDYTAA